MRTTVLLLALTATAHAQWDIQTSNTTASLRGIYAVGHGVAWSSGTNGTVLHTTDNGATWLRCPTPPNAEALDFRGIQAFDAQTAIVMSSGKGDLSRLYKTTDACQTWKLVFTNPDVEGFFDAIQARHPKPNVADLMVVGDPVKGSFTLFYLEINLPGNEKPRLIPFPELFCNDQDIALQLPLPTRKCLKRVLDITNQSVAPQNRSKDIPERYQTPVPQEGEALFAASNSSLAFNPDAWYAPNISIITGGPKGPRFLQLRSTECAGLGCEEWIKANLPLSTGEAAGAFSIAWRQGKDFWSGVVVGGDYKKPNDASGTAALSADDGQHWTAAITPPHGYRSAVAYDAPSKTWITVGPNGTDISTDDGRNWRPLKPSPTDTPDADRNWNALSLPFVVGPHGRIGLLNPTALKP